MAYHIMVTHRHTRCPDSELQKSGQTHNKSLEDKSGCMTDGKITHLKSQTWVQMSKGTVNSHLDKRQQCLVR